MGFSTHMECAGLGHISEAADGEAPHNPGGCIAQAWSVAELLRAAVEDIYRIHLAEDMPSPLIASIPPE